MKTWSLISAALLTGVYACSSGSSGGFSGSPSTNDNEGSSGGASSSGSSGTTTSSGGTNSSSGSTSGVSSSGSASSSGGTTDGDAGVTVTLGDAAVADADIDAPITLTMDSFTVKANSEVYMCQPVGNPFGRDVDIVKMDGTMTAGSHHFFLFNMNASDPTGRNKPGPLAPCLAAGLEFHPFPYLSQQPHYVVEYGAGMGYPLVGSNGLMLNVHYLNTSAQDVTPTVSITIYPAKAGAVTTHVGTIFLNNISINVPAQTAIPMPITSQNTPIGDEDYTIFSNWSHMHQYSVDFTASTGGKQFYEEKDWSEPPLILAGSGAAGTNTSPNLPMAMKAGTSISWTCSYTNPTNQSMTFGDSALTQDMCIYLGQYYPADGTPQTNSNYPDVINAVNF